MLVVAVVLVSQTQMDLALVAQVVVDEEVVVMEVQ
tara:strand:+ start:317 stop:421 length:105 start_codon:yes stop_codon:yes gene_type:complete